jgi:hypothetical protein
LSQARVRRRDLPASASSTAFLMRFQINQLAPSSPQSSSLPWVRTLSGRFSPHRLIEGAEGTNQNHPRKTDIAIPHLQG